MYWIKLIGLFIVSSVAVFGGITTEVVTYKSEGVQLKGYIAYNKEMKGKLPVVLVVHEWWGCNDYARMRADQLAELGYLAFAVDMYGDGKVVTTPDEAGKLAGALKGNVPLMRERILTALEYVKKHPHADAGRIAAIGYCFGGTVALELGRSGADVRGVVSFHGGLATPQPEKTKGMKAKVLVCHGGADGFVPDSEVAAFRKEMDEAGADWQLHIYAGAVHSFTNPRSGNKPETGVAYNEKAANRSWTAMLAFFKEVMK